MVLQATAGAQLAGRYRLDKQLGNGGMGTVWQAYDQVLDRMVAVKFVNSQGLGHPGAESRLQREAKVLGRLTHPHLTHVHDLRETDEATFIVMELVHGESLADLLARRTSLPPGQAAAIAAQSAQALDAAHQAGIVHRDVKPSNIMLDGGNVKLIDFGIAGSLNPTETTMVGMMGTVAYLAPERVTGAPATPASDLYALGVVLYEMLAGHRPFQAGESFAMLYAHVTVDPLPLPAAVPAALAATCLSLLAKDPAARPESGEVVKALLLSADTAPSSPVAPRTLPGPGIGIGPDPGPDAARPRGALLLPAGLLLSAALVACATWLITTTGISSATAQPPRQTPTTAAHPPTAQATSATAALPTAANTDAHTPALSSAGTGPVSTASPAAPGNPTSQQGGPGNGPGPGPGPGPGNGNGNPHPGKSKPKPAHP